MQLNKNITIGIAVLWIVFALIDTVAGFMTGATLFRNRQPLNFLSRAIRAVKRMVVFLLIAGNVFLAFQSIGKIKSQGAE
jgi:hypothetical protein